MKYQIGDTVLLLHSNEEGEVVELLNDQMVMVNVGGVQFPVYMDQIDFPYFKRFSEQKVFQQEKKNVFIDNIPKEKKIDSNKISTGMWLLMLPVFSKDVFDEDIVSYFKIYLQNQTQLQIRVRYNVRFKGLPGFALNNEVDPFKDFYLHDIPFEALNDAPRFEFDFELSRPDKKKAAHVESIFKIKAKQLFQRIEEMRMKNEPSISFLLYENYPDSYEEIIPEYKFKQVAMYDATKIRERLAPARSVIDLHIEKLSDRWQGLSNFEILSIQLDTFEKYYQLAVAHMQPNLIVIHGVGTGKLRNEIHDRLKMKKEVRTFANQFHSNFGFGATEIFFQY